MKKFFNNLKLTKRAVYILIEVAYTVCRYYRHQCAFSRDCKDKQFAVLFDSHLAAIEEWKEDYRANERH